jgi:hypothetical protein
MGLWSQEGDVMYLTEIRISEDEAGVRITFDEHNPIVETRTLFIPDPAGRRLLERVVREGLVTWIDVEMGKRSQAPDEIEFEYDFNKQRASAAE